MAPHVFPRSESISNDYIVASAIAGGIIAIASLSLLCLFCYQKSKANKKWDATSFRVSGVVPMMAETHPSSKSIPLFSRNGLTASIVLPEKSITRKPCSYGPLYDKAVVSSQLPASSTLSLHPLPPKASPVPPHPRAMSILNPAHPRHSRSSSGFSGYSKYSYSFIAGSSSRLSAASFVSPLQARPVHQPFKPVLPDELTLRCGECLTVLRSFDDGWCVVARDTTRSSRALLLATGTKSNGDNVDIGLVPAWAFAKPLEGIASTRPFRSTSLNALSTGHKSPSARDRVLSWANFS